MTEQSLKDVLTLNRILWIANATGFVVSQFAQPELSWVRGATALGLVVLALTHYCVGLELNHRKFKQYSSLTIQKEGLSAAAEVETMLNSTRVGSLRDRLN